MARNGTTCLQTTASWPDLSPEIETALLRGCDELGLVLTDIQVQQLLAYLELLARWNKTYNLTAVREPAHMVSRHLLDSLAVAPHVLGRRLIDVGTGAGLPGVPLAVLYPEREFHLLDSNGKKTRFLFQVKTDLRLANMVVHQARAESFTAAQPFDAVLSRAFASLADMVLFTRHLLAPNGRMLAMKGAYPEAELEAVRGDFDTVHVHPLSIPGLDEQRHLVELL
ncbi:MAG: 16S rRNA (guanine527-N7)-methyltransferase [Bacteroidia bacterium]|jgi:16S rRNA (guanine527-N7)-methyltransferase